MENQAPDKVVRDFRMVLVKIVSKPVRGSKIEKYSI